MTITRFLPRMLIDSDRENAKQSHMKRVLINLLGIVGLICSLSCCSPIQTTTKKKTTVNHVELEVSVPKISAVGQSIDLIVTLINRRKEAIYFVEIDMVQELGIRVTNSKGISPPLTPLGKKRIGYNPPAQIKFMTLPLEGGQSHEWRINLSDYFELSPEAYNVSVSLEVNPVTTPFTISATGLEINVK